jgi:hypothetical protein
VTRIAISYRRDDSAGITGRIFDRLVAHYGADSVFRDVDNIPLGVDFREHINLMLAQTDITLVVVGKRWSGPQPRRRRRIDDPADPVRVEVETALRNGMPVVPVLVEGAAMPNVEQLPDSLKEFVYRNGLEIDSGRDFDQHLERLIRNLEPILARRTKEREEAVQRAEEEPRWAEAARQAEVERLRAEAARQAEEEKRQAEAAQQAEEEKRRGETVRQAEEEQRRAEAARRAEEERQRVEALQQEAARQEAWEKQRAEAARRAEEERLQAEAARQAEEEKRQTEEEKSRAGAARQAEEEKQRAEAARRAEEDKIGVAALTVEQAEILRAAVRGEASASPPGREAAIDFPFDLTTKRLLALVIGGIVLTAVALVFLGLLSLESRTASVAAPEPSSPPAVVQSPTSPLIANRPAKSLDYRDPKTAKQIIDSLGR